MSRIILLTVAVCFFAFSLAANFGWQYASKGSLHSIMAASQADTPAFDPGGDGEASADGECLCKKNTGTINLICGVTLAMFPDPGWNSSTEGSQLNPAFIVSNQPLEFVRKFRRPPRIA